MNTDGSSKGQPGPSSCAGIFRNCRGFVQGCFSSVLVMGFAFEAELVGVMMAVDIAFSKGWHSLWIESDSIYVVSLLRSRSMIVPWNHRNRWLYTLHLIRQMNIVVTHIFREGNHVADALANAAGDFQWWNSMPDFISSAVYRDIAGVSFFRFIHC